MSWGSSTLSGGRPKKSILGVDSKEHFIYIKKKTRKEGFRGKKEERRGRRRKERIREKRK